MSDYIVSARKYRPDSFSSLIGQDNIAQTLKNSITRGQLAHAYLFCGPRGVGKTSAARIFAKTINCSNPGSDMEPCGCCESCTSFGEGRSYCIHELDAASNNGVEDIKALMDQVQIPPQVGRYSVYIIDEVHMLTQSAFNAFLKTLEEPPAHAIFILCTTEKHKIIPTILSRCQTYDFNRISIPDIVRNLRDIASKEGIAIEDEALHVIARKADGAMRDALTIFDQTVAFCGNDIKYAEVIRNLNVLDSEYGFRMTDAFLGGDYASALLTFDEILSRGFNAQHFVSDLGEHLRNLLVSRTGGLEALLDLPDSLRERYRSQASRCSVKFLYDALDTVSRCDSGYRAATNQRLHIEFALMKMAFLCGMPPEEPKPEPAPEIKPSPATVEAPKPEPKPEPKPAPVPEPDPAPATGGIFSLSSLMKEDDELPVPEEDEKTRDGETPLPSEELVVEKWKELAAGIDNPRLSSALVSARLETETVDGSLNVAFYVMNENQQKWINSNMIHKLSDKFKILLGSSRVRLEVRVTPSEAVEDKPYMPAEKAKDLMEKNAEVRSFVAELGLDI